MKARHEFKTDLEYENYMKNYYAGLALSGLLLSNDFEDESLLVKKAIDIANLMVAQLFSKSVPQPSIKEKPSQIEPKDAQSRNKRNECIELTDSAQALFNQKAYKSALTQFEKALALDNYNKKIINSIIKCKQWIKAVDDLNKLDEETQFIKEEFTTDFPPLD